MPGYKPTQNAQDIKFTFELYGGPAAFSLVIPASELGSYALGAEILIGDKYIGEVTKRTKVDDFTYLIEGDGAKSRLTGIIFKGKYNVYDDGNNLIPGAVAISDIGSILNDVAGYITPLGISFSGSPPYLVTGISPYNCDLTCSVADIITHIAQAAGKGWHIDQSKRIVFADIVKYSGSTFIKEVSNDIVNIIIIKGNVKPPYLDSTSELEKFKYFSTITDNSGLFCPTGYIGQAWQSQDPRFESPSKIFIYADNDSITLYGRKEAQIEVPYIDTNTEAGDFATEYFLNNAAPIKSETSYTIDVTEEYPFTMGAKMTRCRLLPIGQLRADYYYYSSEDSLYNTGFITGVRDNNKERLINELDTKAPVTSIIDTEPQAYEKSYKKVKNPVWLGSYAKDDYAVSSVKFYFSKWDSAADAWGAYTLIGSGAWNDPPDADSEGYYEYDQSGGYYDIINTGGLAVGDIFRIKTVAKDTSGNAGEDVREYQLKETPPTVNLLKTEPSANEVTYKKAQSPMYVACYAKDDMKVNAVKFYFSKWDSAADAWGAYTLIGSGAWNDPPDADSEGWYEYDQSGGYYDLINTAGLVRGDIFRIKATANDDVGNSGEDVHEYQLDDDPPHLVVSIIGKQTSGIEEPPSVWELYEPFRLRISTQDLSVSQDPVVNYYDSAVTVTKVSGENYWETSDIPAPPKGDIKQLEVTVTNVFGQTQISFHYVKGVQAPKASVPVTLNTSGYYSAEIDDKTVGVQQYTGKVRAVVTFNDPFYKVEAADVKFNIYDSADNLVKTYSDTQGERAPVEAPAGSGNFEIAIYNTDSGLGSYRIYQIGCQVRKRYSYIDKSGNAVNKQTDWEEGAKNTFEFVQKTHGKRVGEIETRIPNAEQKLVDDYQTPTKELKLVGGTWQASDGVDTWDLKKPLELKNGVNWIQYNNATDTWEAYTAGGGAVTIGVGDNPAGTNYETFTLNDDSSVTSYVTIEFKTDIATKTGILRYDKANQKMEMSADNGSTWTDLANPATDKIVATYNGTDYELKVNSSDGSLTFTKDPTGTPDVLLTIDNLGNITVSNNIIPDTASLATLGDATYPYAETYTDTLYADDIGDATSNWRIEWDATNSIAIPHNMAVGFMDG